METPVDSSAKVICEWCLSSVLFPTGKFILVSLKQYVTGCGYSFHLLYGS